MKAKRLFLQYRESALRIEDVRLHLEHFFDGIEHLAIGQSSAHRYLEASGWSKRLPIHDLLVNLHLKKRRPSASIRTLDGCGIHPTKATPLWWPHHYSKTPTQDSCHEYLVSQRLYWCLPLYPHWQEQHHLERRYDASPTVSYKDLCPIASING